MRLSCAKLHMMVDLLAEMDAQTISEMRFPLLTVHEFVLVPKRKTFYYKTVVCLANLKVQCYILHEIQVVRILIFSWKVSNPFLTMRRV